MLILNDEFCSNVVMISLLVSYGNQYAGMEILRTVKNPEK